MNKTLNYISLGVQTLTLVLIGFLLFGGSSVLGGVTNYDQVDTTDGYSVDGTSIINGSGVWTGTITAANAGTFNNTLQVDSIRYGSSPLNVATTTKILSASEFCDNSGIDFLPQGVSSTLRYPSSTALIADCLSLNGGVVEKFVKNTSSSASDLILSAGDASTTIVYSPNNASSTFLKISNIFQVRARNVSSTTGEVRLEVVKFQ